MDIKLLVWFAVYITLATILFNFFRYAVKLNLPSSFILSASVSFLMTRIRISESFGGWLADYSYAIIVLGAIIAIIVATARSGKTVCDSTGRTNSQRKKRTVIFSIRKG